MYNPHKKSLISSNLLYKQYSYLQYFDKSNSLPHKLRKHLHLQQKFFRCRKIFARLFRRGNSNLLNTLCNCFRFYNIRVCNLYNCYPKNNIPHILNYKIRNILMQQAKSYHCHNLYKRTLPPKKLNLQHKGFSCRQDTYNRQGIVDKKLFFFLLMQNTHCSKQYKNTYPQLLQRCLRPLLLIVYKIHMPTFLL